MSECIKRDSDLTKILWKDSLDFSRLYLSLIHTLLCLILGGSITFSGCKWLLASHKVQCWWQWRKPRVRGEFVAKSVFFFFFFLLGWQLDSTQKSPKGRNTSGSLQLSFGSYVFLK